MGVKWILHDIQPSNICIECFQSMLIHDHEDDDDEVDEDDGDGDDDEDNDIGDEKQLCLQCRWGWKSLI